jgi:thioredoxin 1
MSAAMFLPGPEVRQALARPRAWLVACLCAEWCTSCREFRPAFEALAARRPAETYAWLDLEDDQPLLEDIEVETFPTLWVQCGDAVHFAGPLPPRAAQIERLVEAVRAGGHPALRGAIDLAARLRDVRG